MQPKIANGIEKLKSLLSVDIYDSVVKDNRTCALPLPMCKTRKNVSYGKNLLKNLAINIKTKPSPLPTITSPDLSYRKFERESVQTEKQEIMKVIQMLEDSARNVHKLVISYRFLPHKEDYIINEFIITDKVRAKLKYLYNSLSLSLKKKALMVPDMFGYTRKGNGVSGIANETFDKVLVEVITFMNGEYGRFLLLVSLGVSCTVWYIFAPGVAELAPPVEIFPRELSYPGFFRSENYYSQFKKVCFLEEQYITGEVLSALANVFPFNEMDIPVNTNVDVPSSSNSNIHSGTNLKVAVGLGLMVAVFLSLGVIPRSSALNAEL